MGCNLAVIYFLEIELPCLRLPELSGQDWPGQVEGLHRPCHALLLGRSEKKRKTHGNRLLTSSVVFDTADIVLKNAFWEW